MKRWMLVVLIFGVSMAGLQAAEKTPVPEGSSTNDVATMLFHGKKLFEVSNISNVSAKQRVDIMQRRFTRAAKSPLVSTDDFEIYHDENLNVSLIMVGADVMATVWESDALHHGVPRQKLAEQWQRLIQDSIEQYRKDRTTESLTKSGVYAAIATVVFLVIWWAVRKVCKKEITLIEKRFAAQKMFKFLDGDSIVTINGNIVKFVRVVFMLWLFILYLNLVLSFFPWTFNLSAKLFDLVSIPFINFGNSFVQNLPNLFALLVVIAITILVLRGLKNIFNQIGHGRVRIKGFYRDWADPTYRLIRIVVIVFAAVVAFPLIPGSSSPAFKGISIFMGVLLSLGSSSAVGNIVAGLVLTYMRPFVSDDFVEISGLRGIVESRGTFSTRLKTPTNEIISIPNASVSTNHIINFSRMAEKGGVSVGTSVTIGYDVPWRTVHELLIAAAAGVPDVLEIPPPKVLQLSLDDFYVEYKLIVTTKHPERRIPIRSNLHQNIQDRFAEAGIEILSPHYRSNRAGDESTVPTPGQRNHEDV
ncbi:MAG TPA: mechanosensitive ion channel domain-containing protein [Pontiella sp.]|nr:mechanosensitive ion channel domain-containing protein [Pontiella sp.]